MEKAFSVLHFYHVSYADEALTFRPAQTAIELRQKLSRKDLAPSLLVEHGARASVNSFVHQVKEAGNIKRNEIYWIAL